MASDSLSVAQELYARFARGDAAGIAALCGDDVVWRMPSGPNVPYLRSFHGKRGVLEFFDVLVANESTVEFKPLRFLTDRDTVAVLGSEVCRSKQTGKEFRGDWVHVLTVRGGLIREFVEHIDSCALNEAYA